MRIKTTITILIGWLLLLMPAFLKAQTVVTLNGQPNFNTSLLTVLEAGNDFPASISEIQGNTTISVTSSPNSNNFNYLLQVKLTQELNGMQLSIVRTGTGTNQSGGSAGGQISGPMTPIILTTVRQDFFSGKGNRFNVPVSLGISNLSVTHPAGNVPITLEFTVTGN